MEGNVKDVFIVLFSVAIIVWSTIYVELWRRQQVLFAIRFGQEELEEEQVERPAFKGEYIRSVTNDDLNEEFYAPLKTKLKMLFSLAVSVCIIVCVVVCVILIF